MSGYSGDKFDDRRKSSEEARKALLARARALAPDPNSPEMVARREADIVRAKKEAERAEARRIARREEEERLAREKAERIIAAEAAKRAEAARKLQAEIDAKRARDARYAARKARSNKR